MKGRTAITVNLPRNEVEARWRSGAHRAEYIERLQATVTFRDAPGDRGTEIHVDLEGASNGGVAGVVRKVAGGPSLAKVKDDLRRFKQLAETGEIPRSDAAPEGEMAERKLKQRPAQPLEDSELQKAGVR